MGEKQVLGIYCPKCGAGIELLIVRNTIKLPGGAVKRYRKCRGLFRGGRCERTVTTIERVGLVDAEAEQGT